MPCAVMGLLFVIALLSSLLYYCTILILAGSNVMVMMPTTDG